MNGLLIIDKPKGLTSHDVVARIRRILKTKRVGHTGTLDPFATGAMVVLIGQATRLARFLDKDEKEYEAVIRFGFETDTGDLTGTPTVDQGLPGDELARRVREADWKDILARFRGDLMQVPPMYSAKKIEGKKLYELARKGQMIERKAVPVTVGELELLALDQPPAGTVRIRVACSAGTYIRALAEDIGRSVGVGAHLSELRRTRAGRFGISQAVTIEALGSLLDPSSSIIPMSEAAAHLRQFVLTGDRIAKTKNGLSTRTEEALENGEAVRMLDEQGELIAIGEYISSEKIVQPKVVFR